jgi:hypothetical protein
VLYDKERELHLLGYCGDECVICAELDQMAEYVDAERRKIGEIK